MLPTNVTNATGGESPEFFTPDKELNIPVDLTSSQNAHVFPREPGDPPGSYLKTGVNLEFPQPSPRPQPSNFFPQIPQKRESSSTSKDKVDSNLSNKDESLQSSLGDIQPFPQAASKASSGKEINRFGYA